MNYIVEHTEFGIMWMGRGYRDKVDTLFASPRVATIFDTYDAAYHAVKKTIRERERFLLSLPTAGPNAVERDEFTKKWKYRIRRVASTQESIGG